MSKHFYFKVLLLFCIALACKPYAAFTQAFSNNSTYLSVGYGLAPYSNIYFLNNIDEFYTGVTTTTIGPLYLKYERALSDDISIGVNVALLKNRWFYTYPYYDNNYYTYNPAPQYYQSAEERFTYSVMVRFNYHFFHNDKYDFYYGGGLGYRGVSRNYSTNSPDGYEEEYIGDYVPSFPVAFETTIGGKYMIGKHFAIYSEIGVAKSVIQVGMVYGIAGKK